MIDLIQYKNDEVKSFQEKIIPDTKYEILGIYSKIIKEIAKENKNNKEFLKEEHHYLEEYMVHALILGYLKDFDELLDELSSFVYKIDNWALCDTLCASLKITNKHMDEMLEFIKKYNKDGYLKRFFIVMLKCYYVNDLYLDYIFNELDKIDSTDYYINMGAAWLLSECFIKYPNETFEYMKKSKLNKFAFNKGISKIHDSYRVSDEYKIKTKELRK